MHQTALALSPVAARPLPATGPDDTVGFEIGWAHAQHGLVPPPELLLEGTGVSQGWRAARAVLGRRTLPSTRALRQWLALRTLAWRQGAEFDTTALGPAELAQLETGRCPVRCQPLGGAERGGDAPVVFRLHLATGYRPGNLVVLSRAAVMAAEGATVADALRQARAADASGMDVRGLHAAAWRRLAVLLSFAHDPAPAPAPAPAPGQACPDAARLPLLMLPPPGIVPRHPVQRLQWLLTLLFQHPGWSARTRSLAATLPREAQRTDFHLFVSALASRVLEAQAKCAGNGTDPSPSPLEHAWLHERVQRRWHQLALALGARGCQALLLQLQATPGRKGQAGDAAAGTPPARPAAVLAVRARAAASGGLRGNTSPPPSRHRHRAATGPLSPQP